MKGTEATASTCTPAHPVHPRGSSHISVTHGSWRLAEGLGSSYGGSGVGSSAAGSSLVKPVLPTTQEDGDRGCDFRYVDEEDCESNGASLEAEPARAPAADEDVQDERRRNVSILRRTLIGLTSDGIRHSTLTLVATALGAVALSISYVFQLCGLALGTASLVLGAFLGYLSTVALMEMCTQTGCSTYASLFSHVAGRCAGPCLDLMIFIYGNGVLVLCLVFLGDFIPSLVNLAPEMPAWATDRRTAIAFCAALVFPLGLPKEISALAQFTKLQIFGIAYTAVLVAVKAPGEFSANSDKVGFGSPQIYRVDLSLIEAFPLCIYAYNCHANVVPIAGRLVRPTRARIVKLSSWVGLMQLVFYMVIGISGYLSFLDKTPSQILKCYSLHDPFVVAGRAVLTPSLIVVIGMNLQPAMRSGLRVLDHLRDQSQTSRAWAPASPLTSPLATPTQSPRISPRPSLTVSRQSWADGEHKLPVVVLTMICLVVQVGIAIVVPNAADIIGLVGATAGAAMMLLIPAYAIGVVMPRTPGNIAKQVILYSFALVALASVPIKVLRLAGVIKNSAPQGC